MTLVPSKLLSEIFEYDTPSDNPLQNRRLPRQPQAPDPRSTSTLIARQRGGNANRDGGDRANYTAQMWNNASQAQAWRRTLTACRWTITNDSALGGKR